MLRNLGFRKLGFRNSGFRNLVFRSWGFRNVEFSNFGLSHLGLTLWGLGFRVWRLGLWVKFHVKGSHGNSKREPQEYNGNTMEYKDPCRYIPTTFLGFPVLGSQ